MATKKNPTSGNFSPIFFWIPALAPWCVALFVIGYSFRNHNFVQGAFFAQHYALNGLSAASFALAALLLIPSFRAAVVDHLDGLSSVPPRRHALWIAGAYGGIWAWLGFIRYCEYRGFLLATDTAVSVNEAYNFIHHGRLYMSVFGVNPLSIHFNLLRQMLSPALLVWNHPLSVIFLEDAFLLSAPIAVYCLAYSLTESSLAGFCGFLLTISTPYFYELLTSNLCVSAAAVLFPWAMFFFGRKRWWAAGLMALVMVGSTEAMPLTFFGLGLYFIFASDLKMPRSRWIGLAVCAASIAWWFCDMGVIRHFARAAGTDLSEGYWLMFKDMVPTGTPAAAIPRELASHPLRELMILTSSRFRFYHVLRVLFFMGFLCLADPAATLPFLTAVFPHVLAAPGTPMQFLDYRPFFGYYDFDLHEGAFMFAPLLWSTAMGIKRLHDKLSPRGRQGWLLAWVFLVAGLGFRYAHRTLKPDWRTSWFDVIPSAIARLPPQARLWADDYSAPLVSNRRWIKLIQWGPDWPEGFGTDLFTPDYVLLYKGFVIDAKPPYRDQMLTYLGQNGYRKIMDDQGVIVLESPHPSSNPEDVPAQWVTIPRADPEIARAYARYLIEKVEAGAQSSQETPMARAAEYNNMAAELARQGRFDEAIRRFKMAVEVQPDNTAIRNNLGATLAQQGKYEEALAEFRRVLQRDPANAIAQRFLSNTLARLEERRSSGPGSSASIKK
jgi:hypothetical protein